MAGAVRGIARLCLRTQDQLVHQSLVIMALDLFNDLGQMSGLDHLSLGERDVHALQNIAEAIDPVAIRAVMGAIEGGLLCLVQRLGGGDIGGNHEFLDQPVTVETRAGDDFLDVIVIIKNDHRLRQV